MKLGGLAAPWLALGACCAVGVTATSCGDEFEPMTPSGVGATGGSGLQGGSGAEGGSGATGGAGGAGGAGGGPQCQPSDEEPCYEGPPATEDVGICHGGTRSCQPDGRWGDCVGQQVPEAEVCTQQGDEDCDGLPCSEHIWSGMYGSILEPAGIQQVHGVGVDSVGNVAITGRFSESVSIDGVGATSVVGAVDVFVASFDVSGDVRWSITFGDTGADVPHGLAVDASDHVWVVGEFRGTLPAVNSACPALTAIGTAGGFVVRLDGASGDCLSRWQVAQSADANGDKTPRAVAIGPSGHVYVAGDYTGRWGSLGPLSQGLGAFVRTFDSDGVSQPGDSTFDSPGDQVATAIAVNAAGEVFIGGHFREQIVLGASPIDAVPSGSRNAFVAKRTSAGEADWEQALGHGDGGDQRVRGLALDGAGRVVAVGEFEDTIRFAGGQVRSGTGNRDAFVVQYAGDAPGTFQWAATYSNGTGHYASASAVAATDDGQIALVGTFNHTLDLGGAQHVGVGGANTNAFLLNLDSSGTYLWSRAFGSTSVSAHLTATSVALGGDRVVMGGYSSGAVDFGGGLLVYDGKTYDGFAAVFYP